MELVVYVNVYCLEFKITLGLKGAVLSLDDEVEVDVLFHGAVDSDSESLWACISDLNLKNIEFFPHKARLTVAGRYLNDPT